MTWEQWQEFLVSRTHSRRLMTLEEMAGNVDKQWTKVWKSRETGGKFLPAGGHIVDKKKVEK